MTVTGLTVAQPLLSFCAINQNADRVGDRRFDSEGNYLDFFKS